LFFKKGGFQDRIQSLRLVLYRTWFRKRALKRAFFRNQRNLWFFTEPRVVGKRLASQRISNRRIPRMGAFLRLHAAKATAIQAIIARRRRVAAVVLLDSPPKLACGPQGPKDMEQDRIDWDNHFEKLNDRDFQRRYRLSKTAFTDTYKVIKPLIDTDDPSMALRSSAGPIRGEVRLAATLRWLAGGAWQDLTLIYGLSRAELYESQWKVIDAINTSFPVTFDMTDVETLLRLEAGFALKSRKQNWRGQV